MSSSNNNNSSTKSRSASPRTTFPTNTKATSLCIPRVFKNITQERIARCFALALGVEERNPEFIDRIDMVARADKNGQEFWRVFIHLNEFPNTPEGREVEKRISNGDTVTIVYDDPWYWKVSMSRIARPNQHTSRPRPFIATESSDKGADKCSGATDYSKLTVSQLISEIATTRSRDGEKDKCQAGTEKKAAAMMNDAEVSYCDP